MCHGFHRHLRIFTLCVFFMGNFLGLLHTVDNTIPISWVLKSQGRWHAIPHEIARTYQNHMIFQFMNFSFLDLTKMDGSEPIEIVITSLFMFWVFMEIFLICESGERVTAQFELFGKEFERCNWYKLSLGLQRLYMVFLSDIQKPINIRSFAGIRCTRDTLKNVNRTATLFYSFNSIHI